MLRHLHAPARGGVNLSALLAHANVLSEVRDPPYHSSEPPTQPAVPIHVRVLTTVWASGRPERCYALYRVDPDAARLPQPFVPLLHWFLDRGRARDLSWQRTHTSSLRLLLDHLAAHGDDTANAPANALQRFVDDLVGGTVDAGGHDSRGLYWPPHRPVIVEAHLGRINAFGDWLSERLGQRSLNPWRTATPQERIVQLRRFERRTAGALLAHAAYRSHEKQGADHVRSVRAPRGTRGVFDAVKAFREDAFLKLIKHGWSKRARHGAPLASRYRLRDLMVTLLMHGGGLRVSEPFHLFVGDVVEDPDHPGSALVHLFHPERGAAPEEEGGPWRDREHYLLDKWKRRPRTLETGALQAGWKNLALTDTRRRASQVYWFPEYAGAMFWTLYRAYLRHRPDADHPWLFVSERKTERGQPYSIAAFEQAHARAVRRVGLLAGKAHGTSPHGHRHAYGLALKRAGLDRRVIQRALHHRNPASQDVYTEPEAAEITSAMSAASRRLGDPFLDLTGEPG